MEKKELTNKSTHKTVRVSKILAFTPTRVFDAYADVKARVKWSVPKGDAIKYMTSDFQVGGKDTFKCGVPKALDFNVSTHYEDIVKNERVIFTESVSRKKKLLCSALITLEFISEKGGTKLKMIAQIASVDEIDMSKGYKQGWKAVFENLEEFLSKKS